MTTIREAINTLKSMKGQHVILDVWCENDVLEYAQQNDIQLTRKQARKVIDIIDKNIDNSVGINWDTISETIDDVLEKH